MGMIAICDGCGKQVSAIWTGKGWDLPEEWRIRRGMMHSLDVLGSLDMPMGSVLMTCSRECRIAIGAKLRGEHAQEMIT